MGNREELRPFVEWYLEAIIHAVDALLEERPVNDAIHKDLDAADDTFLRNVLMVKIAEEAQKTYRELLRQDGAEPPDKPILH